jgi:phenylacetate-CoA ligase
LAWTAYLARHWRGQAGFPYRSAAAIERAQTRRIRRMVEHAFRTVPFYRESMQRLGLTPADFRTAADLGRLPLIDRSDLRRDVRAFASTAPRRGGDLEIFSGGSSGLPRTITWSTAGILQNAAHSERERSIIAKAVGRFVGYRETVLASPLGCESKIQAFYGQRAALPSWARIKYQYLSLMDPPERNVEPLNRFKPHVIRSYGSYLDRLFRYLHRTGVEFHRPRVVFYDADALPEPTRALIEEEFGICVLSAYQAAEAFKIGFECERHAGYHLNTDVYPIRIVDRDGRDVADGESGEVVVSNLVNHATVLLNYRLGDVAHLLTDACACGRTLPLLSFIEGRTDDWVVLTSGESTHPQSVRSLFTNEPFISQYQVVQRSPDHFTVAIVGATHDAGIADRVKRRFRERFGNGVRTDVDFVNAIEPSAGGKVRPVVSLVRAPNE